MLKYGVGQTDFSQSAGVCGLTFSASGENARRNGGERTVQLITINQTAMPRPATGSAVDPIMLEPVDEVVVTRIVDNVCDALDLCGSRSTGRAHLLCKRGVRVRVPLAPPCKTSPAKIAERQLTPP